MCVPMVVMAALQAAQANKDKENQAVGGIQAPKLEGAGFQSALPKTTSSGGLGQMAGLLGSGAQMVGGATPMSPGTATPDVEAPVGAGNGPVPKGFATAGKPLWKNPLDPNNVGGN